MRNSRSDGLTNWRMGIAPLKASIRQPSIRLYNALIVSALLASGCGQYARDGQSPGMVVVKALEAASGATPGTFGGTLSSDVETVVGVTPPGGTSVVAVPTIFGDVGRATMTLVLKDQGVPGTIATASPLNQVTISRYRVSYRRTDGRNTQGVDVPFAFDSAVTVTVPAQGDATVGFLIVRNTAKQEAPLASLRNPSQVLISTIADVTFYGRDLAGNDVLATGSIGITFGDFGDPK